MARDPNVFEYVAQDAIVALSIDATEISIRHLQSLVEDTSFLNVRLRCRAFEVLFQVAPQRAFDSAAELFQGGRTAPDELYETMVRTAARSYSRGG